MKIKLITLALLVTAHTGVFASETPKSKKTGDEPGLFEDWGKKMDKATHTLGEQLDEAGVTAKIVGKYSVDSKLGPFKIQVYTDDDNVRLVGEVKTGDQYERAVLLAAATASVEHVDASRLKITDKNAHASDLYLSALIKAEMIKNRIFEKSDTSLWPVTIVAKDNVVTASGALKSNGKKQQILEIIESFEGIESIEDNIKIIQLN